MMKVFNKNMIIIMSTVIFLYCYLMLDYVNQNRIESINSRNMISGMSLNRILCGRTLIMMKAFDKNMIIIMSTVIFLHCYSMLDYVNQNRHESK